MTNTLEEAGEPAKRLFFALECPAEQRKAISRWRSTLALGSGRRVPAANVHLTLLFLGEVGLSRIQGVVDAAARVTAPSGRACILLDRLETWRRPGVLVLAPQDPPKGLLRLAYDLQQAFQPVGVMPGPAEYRPHITLVRDYREPPPEAVSPPDFIINASHFTLFESRKGEYVPLERWPLA